MTRNRPRMGKTCRAMAVLAFFCALPAPAVDDPLLKSIQNPTAQDVVEPVGLVDWPALARALKADKAAQGRIVSFRELWLAKPGDLAEPLSISGVVLRRFRREPVGQFPALEELWVHTDDDNLLVVTHPSQAKSPDKADITAPGSAVDLVATYMRNVRYNAADEPRVAPWLVARSIVPTGAAPFEQPSLTGTGGTGQTSELMLVLFAVISTSALLRVALFYARRSGRGKGRVT